MQVLGLRLTFRKTEDERVIDEIHDTIPTFAEKFDAIGAVVQNVRAQCSQRARSIDTMLGLRQR